MNDDTDHNVIILVLEKGKVPRAICDVDIEKMGKIARGFHIQTSSELREASIFKKIIAEFFCNAFENRTGAKTQIIDLDS